MAKLKTGRHTGAQKAARQALKRMLRNRVIKRGIRAAAKGVVEAASKRDLAGMPKLLSEASSAWDKAAKSGVIHWKTAARKKSRLARLAVKAQQPAAAPVKA